jgi:hypothetical protein
MEMDNYNYPIGSDTSDAPWNQSDPEPKAIEVTVSVTLSKTIKILVNDYIIEDKGIDEDGEYFEDIDYSNCDLKSAVENQYTLPQDAGKYIGNYAYEAGYKGCPEAAELSNWNVDDFEVILE